MKKRILSMLLVLVLVFSFTHITYANNTLTSDSFTLYVDIINPDGGVTPSELRFNLFTEENEWLANRCVKITDTNVLVIDFDVPEYEIGTKFKVVTTTGAVYTDYCNVQYKLNEEILVETYAYRDSNGELTISDYAHMSVCPLYMESAWETFAENHVNNEKTWSDTPYLIWVSKANYKVSVFLRENGQWDCIKVINCSVGAPETPTVTGQFKYFQYQKKWDYGTYYVGPIMRFYGGYAIHSTLVNNDGSDRDGRIGKMISHGCVRVRPGDIQWLTDYIPLGTKIYVTNE